MSINIKNFVFCLIWIKNFPYNKFSNNNCMLHFFDEKIRKFLEYFLKIFYLKIFRLLKRKSCKLDNIVCSRTSWLDFSQWYVSINVPTECQVVRVNDISSYSLCNSIKQTLFLYFYISFLSFLFLYFYI